MTTETGLKNLDVDELVQRFVAIAIAQREAADDYQTSKYNRLFDRMEEVESELKLRDGDQRSALLPLLESRDIHVRLKAALAVLAVAPDLARKVLESVRDFGLLPQSLDATLMLASLRDGSYVPE